MRPNGELFRSDSIVLIDAKNFLFRNYFPHSALATSSGEATGALFGCLNGLVSLANKLPEMPIVFCWDGSGVTWRHTLMQETAEAKKAVAPVPAKRPNSWFDSQVKGSLDFMQWRQRRTDTVVVKAEGYKGTRDRGKNDLKASALGQVAELKRVLAMIGIRSFEVNNLEGDDLIGILATALLDKKLFAEVIINSTDNDFIQLMARPGIRILKGLKESSLLWAKEADIFKEHGVMVADWLKYRAIVGDKSDNIPNLFRGIGPAKGLRLLQSGLDASKKNIADIPERAWMAAMEYVKDDTQPNALWQRLRRNYLLSHIVCDENFRLFGAAVRRDLNKLLQNLQRQKFFRSPDGMGEDAYRSFSEWLIAKEMDSLRTRKDEFFQLV